MQLIIKQQNGFA